MLTSLCRTTNTARRISCKISYVFPTRLLSSFSKPLPKRLQEAADRFPETDAFTRITRISDHFNENISKYEAHEKESLANDLISSFCKDNFSVVQIWTQFLAKNGLQLSPQAMIQIIQNNPGRVKSSWEFFEEFTNLHQIDREVAAAMALDLLTKIKESDQILTDLSRVSQVIEKNQVSMEEHTPVFQTLVAVLVENKQLRNFKQFCISGKQIEKTLLSGDVIIDEQDFVETFLQLSRPDTETRVKVLPMLKKIVRDDSIAGDLKRSVLQSLAEQAQYFESKSTLLHEVLLINGAYLAEFEQTGKYNQYKTKTPQDSGLIDDSLLKVLIVAHLKKKSLNFDTSALAQKEDLAPLLILYEGLRDIDSGIEIFNRTQTKTEKCVDSLIKTALFHKERELAYVIYDKSIESKIISPGSIVKQNLKHYGDTLEPDSSQTFSQYLINSVLS